MLIITGVLLVLAITTEMLRMHTQTAGMIFKNLFGALLRSEETQSVTAATYLFLSCFLCILLFHKYIAIFTLLCFIAGDAMAGLVGRKYGTTPMFNKSLEGFLSGAITGLIIALIFPVIPFALKLLGVILISFVEVIPMRTNDNIRVPLVCGSLLELLYIIDIKNIINTGIGTWI